MGSGQSFEEKQEKVGEMVKSWKDLKCNTLELVKKYRLIRVVDAFWEYFNTFKTYTGCQYMSEMKEILVDMTRKYEKTKTEMLLDYCMSEIRPSYRTEYEEKIKTMVSNLRNLTGECNKLKL